MPRKCLICPIGLMLAPGLTHRHAQGQRWERAEGSQEIQGLTYHLSITQPPESITCTRHARPQDVNNRPTIVRQSALIV